MVETLSLKIARLESILISNKKFSKKWLNMLESHTNGCPCVHYKKVKSTTFNFKFRKCPFGLREHGKNDDDSHICYQCEFSSILIHREGLRYFHLTYAIKNVLGINHGNYDEGDSFYSPEI